MLVKKNKLTFIVKLNTSIYYIIILNFDKYT